MSRKPEYALLYSIARSYYIENLSQSQIAERENISRSQISRLLDKAKSLGIVNITVTLPDDPDNYVLVESAAKVLGIREVVIAPVDPEEDDPAAISEAIAHTAALYLPKALKGCKTVGLGWGKTMYNMSLHLNYRNVGEERIYVPMVGVSGTSNPSLQVNTIIDRVAERHRARSYFVNVPTLRDTSNPISKIDEQRMAALEAYWSRMDAAVFGLGGPPKGDGIFMEEASPRLNARVASCNAVGDVLSHFFYEDGSAFEFGRNYRHNAYDIQRLRKVRKSICLAGGPDKVEGIIVAARCGYFNTLITDSNTAKIFYDRFRNGGASNE